MNSVTINRMSHTEAIEWKAKVGETGRQLRVLLFEGYERCAWETLGYSNWTECVKALADEFGFTERRLWQLHEANRIEANLATEIFSVGDKPDSHLRPLAALEPAEQRAAWSRAVATAPNGRMTAAHVERTVAEYKAPSKVYWSPEPAAPGTTVVGYIEASYPKPTPPPATNYVPAIVKPNATTKHGEGCAMGCNYYTLSGLLGTEEMVKFSEVDDAVRCLCTWHQRRTVDAATLRSLAYLGAAVVLAGQGMLKHGILPGGLPDDVRRAIDEATKTTASNDELPD